ncbi:hypothetical protein NPIL_459391 [Nephila pilipes]|uniref:Uncharacterized protein n=1 Tax=Nephila pilipes TaxID=299642 RepID=A0A8X6NBF4_NEPPI|nr:hypothetical protein NPIL_459391 [Nephila pilipes]
MSTEMANSKKLSEADIAKLIGALDSEEENVSEYENHTSEEIESDSSDNDFGTDIQQMRNVQNIYPKNRYI